MKEKENKNKDKVNIISGISQSNLNQLHGEGASQILQAYKGIRIDSLGNEIAHHGRGLKQISEYEIDSKNSYGSYKQQAGFSGELIKEARDNKESILKGEESRTRTTDGIGKTNDQYHDHIKVDRNGNVIEGSGSQMKIKGKYSTDAEIRKSSENIVQDMISKKWDKYQDSPMDLPTEQVEYAKKFAQDKANELRKQADKYRTSGNENKALMLEDKAQKYEKARDNIRDSGVSSEDAMNARMNPEKFVKKEMINNCHNAGVQAAKSSFILSGAISGAQNIYSVVFEEKEMEDAIKDVAITTATSTVTGYVVGASGTAIKAMMHSSKNSIARTIGKSNAPTMISTGILEVGKSLTSYAKGEIDEEQLLVELGEKGTGMVAASYGTAIGTAILPGLGSIVGGMVGYTVSSILYNGSLDALKSARISEERRIIIERVIEESIQRMKEHEREFKMKASSQLEYREVLFSDILNGMRNGILNDNIEDFFTNVNTLGKFFGFNLEFNTFDEFDDFMSDDDTILVL